MSTEIGIFGYLSLDTLMYKGNKFYDVPGGGALYASLAALVNGRTPILNVCVGNDFPESVLVKLRDLGVNLNSIQYSNIPSRRASLKYINGNETESTHYSEKVWWDRTEALRPPLTDTYFETVVLAPMPLDHAKTILASMDPKVVKVLDTSKIFARNYPLSIIELLTEIDYFIPSIAETRILMPGCGDDEAAMKLAQVGTKVIQKRGAQGLIRASKEKIEQRQKSHSREIIDPTGAGDSVTGAIAAAVSKDLPEDQLLSIASQTAALTVSRLGPQGLNLN